MSGPLDRPSSSDPDDLDRPSQDRDPRSQDAQPAEPWSPSDPWQESRREPPGWDDWPPAAPPPDDYGVGLGPSQDLWAESWEDEAASTLPRSGYEPAPYEPAPGEPEPYEHEPYETTPEPIGGTAPSAAESAEGTLVEPGADEAPIGEDATPPPWPGTDAAVTSPADPVPAPVLPDWLAEPLPESWPTPPAQPQGAASDDWGRDLTPPQPAAEPEPPSWLDAGPVGAPPAFLDTEPEAEPAAPDDADAGFAEVGAGPVVDEAIVEPPPSEPPAAASVDAEETDSLLAAEQWQGREEGDRIAIDDEAEESELEQIGAQQPVPAPGPVIWEETDPEEAAEADAEPEAKAEPAVSPSGDGQQPAEWSDLDESTRVLPTSWTPPPATPPAPETGSPGLEPAAGEIRTSLGEQPDADLEAEAESTTAEQAVPWLIGLILLLAGMVIVLLALIFAGDQSLGAPSPQPSPSVAALLPSPSAAATQTTAPSVSASPELSPTPVPAPDYGPLEMVYQGRSAALAPIYLLVHDFTTEDEEVVLAQDPTIDVRRFAWAPDGTVGAGLLADILVSIEPGESKRNLGEGLTTVTFGADTSMVYAVRVTADGANDTATVLAIEFASGDSSELASVSYTRPSIGSEAPLPEAQFSDDGGTVRLFWMSDGTLRLWVLGAGTWQIDPDDGALTELEGAELPVLVDPDNSHRIELEAADDNATTEIRYVSADGDVLATASAPGLVSHLRWSRGGDRVVFTVGRTASGGGVVQDLFLWDLDPEVGPTQITNTGAAFGAEWRGAPPRWEAG